MKDMECPYCHVQIREPDECNEVDRTYEHECPECGKNFTFTVSYSKSFRTRVADCLNGGPHNYRPIIGLPESHFKGKLRCSMCDCETTTTAMNP